MVETDIAKPAYKHRILSQNEGFQAQRFFPSLPFMVQLLNPESWLKDKTTDTPLSLWGHCVWMRHLFHCCLSQRWPPSGVSGFPSQELAGVSLIRIRTHVRHEAQHCVRFCLDSETGIATLFFLLLSEQE